MLIKALHIFEQTSPYCQPLHSLFIDSDCLQIFMLTEKYVNATKSLNIEMERISNGVWVDGYHNAHQMFFDIVL